MAPATSKGYRFKAFIGASIHRCAQFVLQGQHLTRSRGRLPVGLSSLVKLSLGNRRLHELHLSTIQRSNGCNIWIAQKRLIRPATDGIKNGSEHNSSCTTDIGLGHHKNGRRTDRMD